MIKAILRAAVLIVFLLIVLAIGGYTPAAFKSEIHLKSLSEVPIGEAVDKIADSGILDTTMDKMLDTSSTDHLTDESSDKTEKSDKTDKTDKSDKNGKSDKTDKTDKSDKTESSSNSSDVPEDIDTNPFALSPYKDDNSNDKELFSYSNEGSLFNGASGKDDENTITLSIERTYKISYGDKQLEFSSKNTLSFVKWLYQNFDDSNDNSFDIVAVDPNTQPTDVPKDTTDEVLVNSNVPYNKVLKNVRDLNVIVDSIKTVKKLPDYKTLVNDGTWPAYDRNEFETPTMSYSLNGKKYNRNDYAWLTSPYLEREVPFKYVCPYTGTIVTEDPNLDYDHIVPLKSAYIRGAKDWSKEKKNQYAYDQWVGVDVLNSANRSKSDKGPLKYMPDQNKASYCYSWLLICSKYELSMTKEEVEFCVQIIKDALATGETVQHLGGSYNE